MASQTNKRTVFSKVFSEEGKAEISNKRKAIHLTPDDESAEEEPSKMAKTTRKTRTSASQAMEAMSTIGAYLGVDRVRELEPEDTRATNSVHMEQLQSALTELRELRSENKQLSESLRSETHRADKLDIHIIYLKDKVEDLKAENSVLKADLRSVQQCCRHQHSPCSSAAATDTTRSQTQSQTPAHMNERAIVVDSSLHHILGRSVAVSPNGSKTCESLRSTGPKIGGAALPNPFL